jgi:hypothetical protein
MLSLATHFNGINVAEACVAMPRAKIAALATEISGVLPTAFSLFLEN